MIVRASLCIRFPKAIPLSSSLFAATLSALAGVANPLARGLHVCERPDYFSAKVQ